MLAIDQSGNKLLEFIKITEEDAVLQFSPITVCLLVVKIGKDYLMGFNHWRKVWEIFGVSLVEEYLEQIEKLRIDREEIEKIALLGEISSNEEIRELDRKLTEFY
ncbi:MAG: hypothetical protein IJC76_09955 [Lachnospiraceae bacterium]|nr:hypothetical protein [Lachnospiraceae bacterium]